MTEGILAKWERKAEAEETGKEKESAGAEKHIRTVCADKTGTVHCSTVRLRKKITDLLSSQHPLKKNASWNLHYPAML